MSDEAEFTLRHFLGEHNWLTTQMRLGRKGKNQHTIYVLKACKWCGEIEIKHEDPLQMMQRAMENSFDQAYTTWYYLNPLSFTIQDELR